MRRISAVVAWMVVAGCAAAGAGPGEPVEAPGAAAGGVLVQPGAPGAPSRVLGPGDPSFAPEAAHTPADADFMRGMIAHHGQAIRLADLVPERTATEEIRILARRIELSQHDEMEFMRRWLEHRGEPVGDPHAGHGATPAMPGMFTEAEIEALAGTTGAEFDRLFLDYMIRHHAGALEMVGRLLATDGAARQVELYQFATHVDSDQRMEIDRMEALRARR